MTDPGHPQPNGIGDPTTQTMQEIQQQEGSHQERSLIWNTPATTRSFAGAVVIKNEDVYLLTTPGGSVPLSGNHAYGLYYHDCRYLNGYEMRVAGKSFAALLASSDLGYLSSFEYTNPLATTPNGKIIVAQQLGISRERIIDAGNLTLRERISFTNYSLTSSLTIPVTLTFQSAFEDIFVVRGLIPPAERNKLYPPQWKDDILQFLYHGADGLYRSLSVHFSPSPRESTEGAVASFDIDLQPRETRHISLALVIAESSDLKQVEPDQHGLIYLAGIPEQTEQTIKVWMGEMTGFDSDDLALNWTMERALRDLRMLRSTVEQEQIFAAGLPGFATLFGRDSVITAMQMLAYDPRIAEHTIQVLAKYQGQRVDAWRDEQPGKILHELRVGELTRLNVVPFGRYYGTVDATPLFLILFSQHAAWTGRLDLFRELQGNVERALEWIDRYGDLNGDGFIEYQSTSTKGLTNQGWKDSGDAIVNADGTLATPPIALVEVQGYVYLAKIGIADLYERAGNPERAAQLRKEAAALREKFNREFWLEDKGFYALALQKDHKPCAVLSSNPGQALWSGIVDPDKARLTATALMGADMFTGYGIRTLSEQEFRYNPLAYQLGSVWPHDNSLIVAGFRRYGFDDEARQVFTGLLEAASNFDIDRLPELFAGFRKDRYQAPVRYPVACHPQAWASASIPFMVQSLLGLVPEAFEHRLRIVRPVFPHFLRYVELHGLAVGEGRVDLHFERTDTGVAVNVLGIQGELDVVVDLTPAEQESSQQQETVIRQVKS